MTELADPLKLGGVITRIQACYKLPRINLETEADANRLLPTISRVVYEMQCEKLGKDRAARETVPQVRLVRRLHAETASVWDGASILIDKAYWDAFPRRRLRMLCHEAWHAAGFKHRMGIDYEAHERMAAETARRVRGHPPGRRFDDPYFESPSFANEKVEARSLAELFAKNPEMNRRNQGPPSPASVNADDPGVLFGDDFESKTPTWQTPAFASEDMDDCGARTGDDPEADGGD